MVIWIIGLSAAGKSTLGGYLYEGLKKEVPHTVLIDGDQVRRMFGQDQGEEAYSVGGRRLNAERISNLCEWLDGQGIHVVCCILSIFEESRQKNRQRYSKYFEVYIDVPLDTLKKRETKGLYAGADRGQIKNVVGVDIPFTPPANPDYVVDNSSDGADLKSISQDILEKIRQSL